MGTASERPPGEDRAAPASADSPTADAGSLPRDEVMRRSLAGVFFLSFSSAINLVVGFGATLV
ncbi:MAG: hypothetical protein ACRDMZ_10735, partial [Solirubrobacteraceae bacterium]